jgi:hypothetical protein
MEKSKACILSIIIIIFFCSLVASEQQNKILEGIIKIPNIIKFSDIKIKIFTLNLNEVGNGFYINNMGRFIIDNLKENEYLIEFQIEKFNKSLWEKINLKDGKNIIDVEITDDFLINIKENYDELKWLLRGIKSQPLRQDRDIITALGNNLYYKSPFLPFNGNIAYISWYSNKYFYENEAKTLMPVSRTDLIFKGKINEKADWFVSGYINQNSVYTIQTSGGITYHNLDGHQITTYLKYSEEQVINYNNIDDEKFLVRDRLNSFNEGQKNWIGSWTIRDVWDVSKDLKLDYSIQLDYVNFIKDSMQLNQQISFELFPMEAISIYSEMKNSNKSYNQIMGNDAPPLTYQNFTNYFIIPEDFKFQKDTEMKSGLKLNALRNFKLEVGARSLKSNNRMGARISKLDNKEYLELFNAGDAELKGLSLGFSYKHDKWLEAELLYDVLSGEGKIIKTRNEMVIADNNMYLNDRNVSINILEAKIVAINEKTMTKLSVFYKFIDGDIINNEDNCKNDCKVHLLNVEVKQALPILKQYTKCDVEFLILLQNALHKNRDIYIGDWETKSIAYLPEGIAGGFILHF